MLEPANSNSIYLFFLTLASTSCANLPSYLMESSNFNGADGTAVKVRCKLGKIFNSTSEENTVCLWSGEIPQKVFSTFEDRPRPSAADGLDWQAYLAGT